LSIGGRVPLLCECGDPNCFTVLELSKEEYERMKERPRAFVLAPGHASAATKDVVERTDRYEVVQKATSGGGVGRAA
jgi:hypothetical protein